jgi:hypothetical protein
VEAVTRRRVIVLVAAMLVAYAFSLVLVGLAAGFDHGATRWLVAAGVSALAVGMGASALLRAVVLVVDPQGRTIWWTNASPVSRVFKAASLLLRFGCALYAWTLAARALSTGFG